jgi:lipoyl(octanoyl) transferase
VPAGRIPGLTGTWVGADKIGAIGIRISRWITSHGFAFNVRTDLDHFKLIVPCGITDRGVTSLERVTGTSIPMRDVEETISRSFGEVFERALGSGL